MEDNKNMVEHIEKCPFCGETPSINFSSLRLNTEWNLIMCDWDIRCKQCRIIKSEPSEYRFKKTGEFEVVTDGRAKVIEKWNKRA